MVEPKQTMRRPLAVTVFFVSVTVAIGLWLWYNASTLAPEGEASLGRKYQASDFFDDPKVAGLAEAARAGNLEQINAIVAEGVSVNASGDEGITLLMYAMSGDTLKGFERLLELGADPNQQTDDGESAMSFAAAREEPICLEILLAHGGNPNIRNASETYRPTPLFAAATYNRVDNARVLLNAGANVNAKDYRGETVVMTSATHNAFEVMYVLLEAGANFRTKDQYGYTITRRLLWEPPVPFKPEFQAAKLKCMAFLEQHGVDFDEERIKNEENAHRLEELRNRSAPGARFWEEGSVGATPDS